MDRKDLRAYQQAKESGDTDLLLIHKLDKTVEALKNLSEEVKKKSETEITIDIPRE